MVLRAALIATLLRPAMPLACWTSVRVIHYQRPYLCLQRARSIAGSVDASSSAQLPPRPEVVLVGEPHPATIAINELEKQCQVKHTRSSGPGGQHRNKVNTAAVLTHLPTGVTASATEERSQARNSANALKRLRVRLALSLRTEPSPSEPSSLWTARARGGKVVVSESHADFPGVLTEALDWIFATDSVKVRVAQLTVQRGTHLGLAFSAASRLSLAPDSAPPLPPAGSVDCSRRVELADDQAPRQGTRSARARKPAACVAGSGTAPQQPVTHLTCVRARGRRARSIRCAMAGWRLTAQLLFSHE